MPKHKSNTMPHTSPYGGGERNVGVEGGRDVGVAVQVGRSSPATQSFDDFLIEVHGESSHSNMPTIQWLKDTFKTKSARIRYLYQAGHTLKEIQQHLQLRPQHVRNVLTTALKRGPNEGFNLSDGQVTSSINQVPLLPPKEISTQNAIQNSIDNILEILDSAQERNADTDTKEDTE